MAAMNAVYGHFHELSPSEADTWVPPSSPGAGGHRGRYLWTDAFGAVNLVTMAVETSSEKYMTLAKRLVKTVHDVLGRTRDGTARLDRATDEEPLGGGLRIGKTSESGPDCDGQYHHYLTLWMFALNRLSVAAKDPAYNNLAIQLARAIHPHFFAEHARGEMHMVWKISTDMKTVLVQSQGNLDAATGFIIFKLLQDTAEKQGRGKGLLEKEVDDYAIMGRKQETHLSGDPLDLGMGLWVSHIYPDESWSSEFRGRALALAGRLIPKDSSTLNRPVAKRLAFREFGACLGISCCDSRPPELQAEVEAVLDFWENHVARGFEEELQPISQVMYAAARNPGGKFHYYRMMFF